MKLDELHSREPKDDEVLSEGPQHGYSPVLRGPYHGDTKKHGYTRGDGVRVSKHGYPSGSPRDFIPIGKVGNKLAVLDRNDPNYDENAFKSALPSMYQAGSVSHGRKRSDALKAAGVSGDAMRTIYPTRGMGMGRAGTITPSRGYKQLKPTAPAAPAVPGPAAPAPAAPAPAAPTAAQPAPAATKPKAGDETTTGQEAEKEIDKMTESLDAILDSIKFENEQEEQASIPRTTIYEHEAIESVLTNIAFDIITLKNFVRSYDDNLHKITNEGLELRNLTEEIENININNAWELMHSLKDKARATVDFVMDKNTDASRYFYEDVLADLTDREQSHLSQLGSSIVRNFYEFEDWIKENGDDTQQDLLR
jgi:hypothetical protein